MTAIFLTATGTDIGKTFLAVGLIRELRERGREVAAVKPVVSGYEDWSVPASDPARLLAALGLPANEDEIQRISPFRFRAPVAPDLAARAEGRHLDYAALIAHSRQEIAARADVLLIEGIGGVMVPLDERHTVLDWMGELHLPVVLVSGSYLGSISHGLTAAAAVRQRGLHIAAVVVSEREESVVPLDYTTAAVKRFIGRSPVLPLPCLAAGAGHETFRHLADLL